MDFYALSLIFLTISTTGGAINFIVTILRLRAPGMAISRMPLFLYSTLTISFVILFALPALTVACVFLELDRRWGTHFFDIAAGGNPISLAAALLVFRSSLGLRHLSSRDRNDFAHYPRLFPAAHRRISLTSPSATILTGVVGFSVWLHHMFTVGMSDIAMSFFQRGKHDDFDSSRP